MQLGLDAIYLDIDSVNRDDEVTSVMFDPRDATGGTLTFRKARASGTTVWYAKLSIVQDLSVGSLWRLIYDNPGSWYAFRAAWGNKAASSTAPHLTGEMQMALGGDFLGNKASQDDGYATCDVQVKLRGSVTAANPSLVTTGTLSDGPDRV